MPETIHTQKARDAIIQKMLTHIPFDGWTHAALAKAVKDAGFKKGDEHRAFDGTIQQAMDHYFQMVDRTMVKELKKIDLSKMRVRDRISTAVMVRLKLLEPQKEAVRVTLKYLSQPAHGPEGMRYLFRTVDHMWHAAGDTATDFNYYSKRALLAGVYASTLLKWLDDQSFDHMETRTFLDRRIENILIIPKAKQGLKAAFNYACQSFGFGQKEPPAKD